MTTAVDVPRGSQICGERKGHPLFWGGLGGPYPLFHMRPILVYLRLVSRYSLLMCSVAEPNPWLHLLRHPVFDGGPQEAFTVQKVSWPELSNGFGVSHPYLWAKGRGFGWRGKKKQEALRYRVLGYPPFAKAVFGSDFAVAGGRWPKRVQEGFGLEDPPTPFETAARLIEEGLDRVWPKEWVCGRSALLWWLVGIPETVLSGIVPDWEDEAAGAIRVLMRRPTFALWAIGVNLLPLATTRQKAMSLLSSSGHFKREREKIYQSAFVRGVLDSGARPYPVPRALPSVCPLWRDMAERKEWEAQGKWTTRLERFRKEAWDILEERGGNA